MIADLDCQRTQHDETAVAIRRWLDQGDQRAAEWLVRHYRPYVRRIVSRWLPEWWMVEDVMQDVFSRAFAALHRFDPERSFDVWLAAISRNTCAKTLRASRHSLAGVPVEDDVIDANGDTHQPSADALVLRAERAWQIRCLLATLPRQDRLILVLYRIHDLSADEVAARTGLSSGNVRLRALRAQQDLRLRASAMIRAGIL